MTEASITEKLVKNKIKKILETFAKYNDVYTFAPMTMGYGDSGHPDRVLLVNGVFVGIEAKRDENNHHSRPELKPKSNEVMQKRQAKKIMDAGGEWVCIHNGNLQVLVDILNRYSKHPMNEFTKIDQQQIVKLVG